MMDRAERKYIVSMLDEVANAIKYEDKATAATNLGTCIEALIYIRSLFENHFSVNRFIQYDDIISTLLETLNALKNNGIKSDEMEEIYKLLVELVSHVKKLLFNEKEIKREIVFLPYKASMWDCLDTIWRAAVADKDNCNAYVVPIPYADRNPNGSARAWHHEIDLFPKDVPVIDYRKFDLQGLHPDVIFIHNPYDERNIVTSVEANFYSYRIKKYTDKLVYVPYFVSGEGVSQGMCEASALQHVDHVIVESEKIKKMYEEYYPYGQVTKDRFLALGSPKYDKVHTAKKEDYVLPNKWKELVSRKKVILYATTIGDQLLNSDRAIEKLQSILHFFRQRNDVVLWWRPHPLLQNTFDAMRPSISNQYRDIVEQYRKEKWGIYDDTPDLERAITWSDAYYGDGSSLIWLYRETGKPLMINDFSYKTDTVSGGSYFYSCYREGNLLYFVPIMTDLLCIYDLKQQKIISAISIEHSGIDGDDNMFSNVVKIGNRLLLCPWKEESDEFIEYDLETKKQRVFSCKALDYRICGFKFLQYFCYNDRVYFVGYNFFGVVVFDSAKGTFEVNQDSFNFKAPHRTDGQHFWYFAQLVENKLYILAVTTNHIIELNLDNGDIKEHIIAESGIKIKLMYKYKDSLLFVTDNNELILWDIENNEKERVILNCVDKIKGECTGIGIYNDKIYMFFTDMEKNMYYHELAMEERRISKGQIIAGIDLITYVDMKSETECYVGGLSGGQAFFGVLNLSLGEMTRYSMDFPQEIFESKVRSKFRNQGLDHDGKSIILQEAFSSMRIMCDELANVYMNKHDDESFISAGEKIYREIVLGDVK